MAGQIEAWKSLEKKVNAFNDKYPGSGVICIALVSNVMVNAGSDEMKRKFTDKHEVQNLYKEAFLQLTGTANLHIAEEVADETDVNTLLYTHVYDMDVGIMRALISNAAAPPDAISNKDSRRNWYKPENCPVWWQETGLAFKSVSQKEKKR